VPSKETVDPSSFLTGSCKEVSVFCSTMCSHHDVLPCQRPKATGPTDHRLKPLKLWAKTKEFFFSFWGMLGRHSTIWDNLPILNIFFFVSWLSQVFCYSPNISTKSKKQMQNCSQCNQDTWQKTEKAIPRLRMWTNFECQTFPILPTKGSGIRDVKYLQTGNEAEENRRNGFLKFI
jgi:hypothetical protein